MHRNKRNQGNALSFTKKAIVGLSLMGSAYGSSEISHNTCEIQLISKPATILDKDSSQISKLDVVKNNTNLLWSKADAEILKSKGYKIKTDLLASDQETTVEVEQESDLNDRLMAVKSATVQREYREVFAGEGYTKFDCANSVQLTDSKNLKVIFEADGDQFYKISYTSSNIPKECIELESNLDALPDCKLQ